MKKFFLIKPLLFGVFCAFVFTACSDDSSKEKDTFDFKSEVKHKILTIEVINTQNESLQFKTNETQSIFKSEVKQPTLLFFLSKECQECQDEVMHILDLYNKYQEFIQFIAISPKDELESLQEKIDSINPRFKLYAPNDNKNLLSFLNKDDKQSYIVLYDRQGEKIIDYVGLVPEEMIELDIRFQIQDELEAKAQQEMQTLSNEELQSPNEPDAQTPALP